MKGKRIWAILLSLTLLIGLMPVAGMLTTAADEIADQNEGGGVEILQIYVDQTSGKDDDETYDGSKDKPFKTLYKAMQVIESSLYAEGEIIIVGDYTAATAFDMTADTGWAPTTSAFTQWSTPVTIRGEVGKGTNHLYLTSGLYLYGATTFDDLTVNKSASNGDYTIYANHNEIVFGENAHIGGTMTLYGGVYIAQAPNGASAPHKITMNANAISILYLGNLYNHASTSSTIAPSRRIPGVEYIQNSGTVSKLRIGSAGHSNYKSGNVYTDNVNVTINGGKITTVEMDVLPDQLTARTSFTNGAALQFIFNNGTTATVPTAAEIKALATDTATYSTSGDLYVLKAAAGGSQLAVTDEAGKYTVADPNLTAVATDTTDNTKVYESENGVLTVPAGTYTVTWAVPPTVYETAFDAGEKVNLGYYTIRDTANKELSAEQGYARWNVSFDYFLKSATAEPFTFAWGNPAIDNATGSTVLERGLHTATFSIDITSDNYAIDPTFTAKDNTYGTLYAWNLKVTANDIETEHYVHEPWQCSFTQHGPENIGVDCGRTTADVTSLKTLDEYNFDEMDPVCPPLPPTVYETKYHGGNKTDDDETNDDPVKIGLGYYTVSGANKTTSDEQGYARWYVTFDYYLDMDTTSRFTFSWGNNDTANVVGSTSLKKGLHTAAFGIDVILDNGSGYAISPTFTATAGASGTLYTWNLKITVNGVDAAYYVHNPWKCECGMDTCTRTTGEVTFENTLDEYDFEKMDEENASSGGDDMNGDGIISANEATGPVEDNVYRFNFSKYDWEDHEYKNEMIRMAYILFPNKVKEGMELTLSFDYCVQTNCFVYFYNPYASWNYKENPGTQYSEIQEIRTEFWGPVKDTFNFSFTTNENDVKNGGGTRMALAFEATQAYGKSDIYFWNLKLTEKGSDVNLLTFDTFYWNNDEMLEVVDIDPTKLEMWETVIEKEDDDKYDDSVDMDTGDVVIEDDSEPLLDLDTQISVEYEDGSAFDADTWLSVYPYADGELEQAILDVIGDKNYIAYDIGLAIDDAFIDPTGAMKVGIPIPEDFDAEQVFLYGRDEYGMLYAIDYEVTYGMAYFTTDVLGTFILVEGELVLPEAPVEGDEPMDGDEPTDGDEPADDGDKPADTKPNKTDKNKNNKKDDKSNGWILWVAIGGGVVLLAAAAAIILLVLKKKKGAKADAE